ncbi:MAG: DUF3891 family protein [Actinomycetota bacterium]|nr:DUF3891 family protein [Actinomycetota bacterium]
MLVRPEGEGIVAIGQASHAWLSGQLARAWGSARFEAPEPWEEVCLAAEQHDVGMAEWDLAPKLDPQAKRPQSFMEMEIADHLRLWSAAPAKLLTQSRYAALLVSLHGSALYERRDLGWLAPEDAGAVRAYLASERARQERLIALLGADREQLERNQRLLFAWDGLSLALCLGWSAYVAADVPTRGDGAVDVWLQPVAGQAAGRFTVDPWPFAGDEVTVGCEGRRLGARHETESELKPALEQAPQAALDFTLVSPSH